MSIQKLEKRAMKMGYCFVESATILTRKLENVSTERKLQELVHLYSKATEEKRWWLDQKPVSALPCDILKALSPIRYYDARMSHVTRS